jgi:hypothetical protein
MTEKGFPTSDQGFTLVAGKLYTKAEAIELAIKVLADSHPWGVSTKDDMEILRRISSPLRQ